MTLGLVFAGLALDYALKALGGVYSKQILFKNWVDLNFRYTDFVAAVLRLVEGDKVEILFKIKFWELQFWRFGWKLIFKDKNSTFQLIQLVFEALNLKRFLNKLVFIGIDFGITFTDWLSRQWRCRRTFSKADVIFRWEAQHLNWVGADFREILEWGLEALGPWGLGDVCFSLFDFLFEVRVLFFYELGALGHFLGMDQKFIKVSLKLGELFVGPVERVVFGFHIVEEMV